MRIIGTVGLPGSGKGEAATVAEEEGIPVVTMGDIIRRECRNRGLDPAEHHGYVAKALREAEGPDAIAARSLPLVETRLREHDTVLVDGIRSGVEVDRFERAFGNSFVLVSIEAPFDLRAERVNARGRDKSEDDGGESLADRDERELGFGMDEAMRRADVVVENTASLESFRSRIRALLRGDTGAADDDAAASETGRERAMPDGDAEVEP
jgi:dephospho-CoA kinase